MTLPRSVALLDLLNQWCATRQRLEATTRSPVYSQLSETLDGLVTVRAFGTESER